MSDDQSERIVVDLRATPHRERRTRILRAFDALSTGDALVLVDDRDPAPLLRAFLADDAGEFTWDVLERGPHAWRVRVGKARGAAPRPCGCSGNVRAVVNRS